MNVSEGRCHFSYLIENYKILLYNLSLGDRREGEKERKKLLNTNSHFLIYRRKSLHKSIDPESQSTTTGHTSTTSRSESVASMFRKSLDSLGIVQNDTRLWNKEEQILRIHVFLPNHQFDFLS